MAGERLKPCPFCGAEPVLSQDYWGRYDVRCLNTHCDVMPSTRVYDKADDAAAIWNRRAKLQKEWLRPAIIYSKLKTPVKDGQITIEEAIGGRGE